MNALPLEARRRLTTSITDLVQAMDATPTATVPVTKDQWASACGQIGLHDDQLLLRGRFDELARASLREDAAQLRVSAERLAKSVESAGENLAVLACLQSSEDCTPTVDAHAALKMAAASALEAVTGVVAEAVAQQSLNRYEQTLVALEKHQPWTIEDPVHLALGVSRHDLNDNRGLFNRARLLAAFHGRYDELIRRLNHVLSPVAARPLGLEAAITATMPLLLTPDPFTTLWVARSVRRLVLDGMRINAEQTATPLRNMKLDVDRSASSNRVAVQVARQLEAAHTDEDKALLELDIYRRLVEGQLRPWAWTLLQLRGRSAHRVPELSNIRDQLLADGHPLLELAARSILPSARNAAAHEDYRWDHGSGVLWVGSSRVTSEELAEASELAYSFMIGAESGWTCSRAESPTLADLLDQEDAGHELRAIAERGAIEYFGTNGLGFRDWSYEGSTFQVLLDPIQSEQINSCFQALMWASHHLASAEEFSIRTTVNDEPIVTLTRPTVDKNFSVWRIARERYEIMPACTFLPANYETRLAVESPAHAARSVAALAINDALNIHDEHSERGAMPVERLLAIADDLRFLHSALSATADLMPVLIADVLEALDVVAACQERARAALSLGGSYEPDHRLLVTHERLGFPTVAPTIDHQPLS